MLNSKKMTGHEVDASDRLKSESSHYHKTGDIHKQKNTPKKSTCQARLPLLEKVFQDVNEAYGKFSRCIFCGEKTLNIEVFRFPKTSKWPTRPCCWFYEVCEDCSKSKTPKQIEIKIASLILTKKEQ